MPKTIQSKSEINYSYATIKTTQSRIDKGLMAVPLALAKWFPNKNDTIQVYLSDSPVSQAKHYSSYSSRVFCKESFSRKKHGRRNTISRDEFLEWTKSVWTFPAVSAQHIGHPAPFPVELPYRLIQLYTFEGDVVLDPFIGSGQAAIAAIKAKRHYIGYDTNEEYVKLAEKRIRKFESDFKAPHLFETKNRNKHLNISASSKIASKS